MSFGQHIPSPAKKSLLDDPNLNATNEEARPLTYVAGWQRVGITWIDQPRRPRTQAITSGKGGQTTGYKYYADMLALVTYGPVSCITHVLCDNNLAWQGVIERGDEQSITIALGNNGARGNMILFWGRPDQAPYPKLAALGHPPYRGQCYAYFPQFCFGTGRTSAPNVELIIRRVVTVGWLPNIPNNADDANLAVILADLLTNPIYGAGLDPSLFDQAQWLATAMQLAGEDLVGSPVITDGVGVRQLVIQVLEYFYGYLRWTRDNKLQLGLLRDSPADLTTLVKLTASDLVDVPNVTTTEWQSTFNRTVVTNLDRNIYFQASYSQWYDDGNLAITNQVLFQSLERRWITRDSVAANLAQQAGKRYALPQFSGTLQVRRSSVDTLDVGDWFVLDYDATYLNFALVLQITSWKTSGQTTEQVEIEVLGQRITTDPSELYDPQEVLDQTPGAATPISALSQWLVVLLPAALAGSMTGAVAAALAVRGDALTIYANVLDSQDNATYDLLYVINQFASGGTLAADFPASANSTVPMVVNLVGPDTDLPTADELSATNDKLLVFLGGEILAVQGVTVVSDTQVQLSCLRAQFGTPILAHSTGDQAYIIARRQLQPFQVDALDGNGGTYFKVQPGDLSDLYDASQINPQYLQIVAYGSSGSTPVAAVPTVVGHLMADNQDSPVFYPSNPPEYVFTWTQAINLAVFCPAGGSGMLSIYSDSKPATRVLIDSVGVPAGATKATYSGQTLNAAFGSTPSTFYVQLVSVAAPTSQAADCIVNQPGPDTGKPSV